MYQYKSGFAPGEPVTTHARRRYRLHPSRAPNHTGPQPDLSLWLVHYAPADPNDRHPSQMIPIDARTQNTMNTRAYLHQQGQIVQKDFMLHDRANWPTIAFPRGQPRGPGIYGGNAPPARIPQQMAYPPQHAAPGPPAKRVRPNPTASQAAASSAAAVLDGDDEEDTSRGDLFDHTTPREISMARYKQNHEWMEEILSSPYSISQIVPADLGLGVRGELRALTDGIFDSPYDPEKDITRHEYVGRLDPEKAEEFRKRANDSITQTNKEIEKMKAKHAKRLAKLQKGSLLASSEKALRTAVDNPSDTGPEYWRLEGKIDEEDGEEAKSVVRTPAKVADIVAQVEAGYEEPVISPSPPPASQVAHISPPGSNNGSHHSSNHSGVLVGDTDMDMSNSAAGLLDQYHGASSNATPGSTAFTPQAHLQIHSSANTPTNVSGPHSVTEAQNTKDINTADASLRAGQAASNDAVAGDWVLVPPGGTSPPTLSGHQQNTTSAPTEPNLATTTGPSANPSPMPTVGPGSNADTPGMPEFHASPNDFADLADLDSAGEALASYGDDGGDMGDLGMDMDVGMDDSAFGEAFHGVEPREGEADGGMGDM
jgi:hypothetical protein